jgi:hypothetical protein
MTQIFKDYSAFINREDKKVNGVSEEFAANFPEFEKENESNEGCWSCSRCSGCSRCSDLKNSAPAEQKAEPHKPLYPIIENIHQKVFRAASSPNALNMGDWHTCDTTHCRAGWVEHLAGEEGKALARKTSTLFAAMMIYDASSPINVSPTRFF